MKEFSQEDLQVLQGLLSAQEPPVGATGILVTQLKEKVLAQQELQKQELDLRKQLEDLRLLKQSTAGAVDALAESILNLKKAFGPDLGPVDLQDK